MTVPWVVESVDLAELELLARRLAAIVGRGDTLLLKGDLGAGKTTFARFLIRSILDTNGNDEIPSPSYALLQTYSAPRMDIFHYDFFRLSDPSETEELGVSEAISRGLVLIEWPENAEEVVPEDHLEIEFKEHDSQDLRTVCIQGRGSWATRLNRFRKMTYFLEKAVWKRGIVKYLQGDASWRRYLRLSKNGEKVILMDSPKQPDGPPIKDGKPYSAIAHLAEDIRPFVAVAEALRPQGLKVPQIFTQDLENGFLLLEDFGDRVFTSEIAEGRDLEDLYYPAVDVLLKLAQSPPPALIQYLNGETYQLPDYDLEALLIEAGLLIDWYLEAATGNPPSSDIKEEYRQIWVNLLTQLKNQPTGWVLRDFHSPNLILLDGTGIEKVGILDFQDAVRGSLAYDLVSLLQDARTDIPQRLEDKLFEHYCACRSEIDPAFEKPQFKAAYAIVGAQRNSKILGIFARLAIRDGKKDYLAHVPRIWGYLERNLQAAELTEVKSFYDRHLPAEIRRKPLQI